MASHQQHRHLILLNQFTPLTVAADPARNQEFFDMFKVLIQFGSILAVVVLYFHKLNLFLLRKQSGKRKTPFPVGKGACGQRSRRHHWNFVQRRH